MGERGGEGEMYGESNMEAYVTICKIDSQWELRKLKQDHCNNLRTGRGREMGARFKGEEIYAYLWLIHVEV